MGTMKITGLAALALVATLAVTGCSGNSSTATSTGVAATSSAASSGPAAATPAPTPTAAPIKSGQHLTAEQVKSLPQTARAYTLADGSLVATVIGEALPAEVVTDITAKAQVASGGGELNTQVSAAQNTARAEALGATLKADGVATGRLVVAVYAVYGQHMQGGPMTHFWVTSRPGSTTIFNTPDEAKADVEQTFATNPAGVQVVVLSK